jgi:hypothetical protein
MATKSSSSTFQPNLDGEDEVEELAHRRVAARKSRPIIDSDDDEDDDDTDSVGTARPSGRPDPIMNPGQFRSSLTSTTASSNASTSTSAWQTRSTQRRGTWVKTENTPVSRPLGCLLHCPNICDSKHHHSHSKAIRSIMKMKMIGRLIMRPRVWQATIRTKIRIAIQRPTYRTVCIEGYVIPERNEESAINISGRSL